MDLTAEGRVGRAATIGVVFVGWFVGYAGVARWARAKLVGAHHGVDDADIYLRFARQIAEGNGPVWNVADGPVEGFTSVVWTGIAAAFTRLPGPAESLLFGLNVGISAAALGALWLALAKQECLGPRAALGTAAVLALWMAASPANLVWTQLSLLETGLWQAVLVLGACAVGRARAGKPVWLSVTVALLPWVRPEGLAFGAGMAALAAWPAPAGGEASGRPALRCLRPAAVFLGSGAALFAVRLAVFGYPLPNTYYAKRETWARAFELGLEYLTEHLRANLFEVVLLLVAVVALTGFLLRCRVRPLEAAAALVVVGTYLVPLATGGDHFAYSRTLVPAWPLMGALAFALARVAVPARRGATGSTTSWRLGATAILAALFLHGSPLRWATLGEPSRLKLEFEIAAGGRAAGEALSSVFPGEEKPSVGALTIGGLAVAYRGPVVDLLGLANREMAHAPGPRESRFFGHNAFNRDVFFRQQPDLLLLALEPCEPGELREDARSALAWYVLPGLADDARFQELYVPAAVEASSPEGAETRVVCLYARRDVAARLPDVIHTGSP